MSTAPDRDRDIERLLRRALPGEADASPACLDAEELAAWADGGLDALSRGTAEAHVAGCARCQSIVATLVRIEPAAPAVAPWWRTVSVRWMAPAALVAAAATVWVLLPGPTPLAPSDETPRQARRDTSLAVEDADAKQSAEAAPSAAPAAPSTPPPPGRITFGAETTPRPRAMKAEADAVARETVAPSPAPPVVTTHPAAPTAFAPVTRVADDTRLGEAAGAAAGAVASRDANRMAAGTAAAMPQEAARLEARDAAKMALPAAAAATAPQVASPGEQRFDVAGAGRALREGLVTVRSPDGREHWHVSAATIGHSVDGGRTWDAGVALDDAAPLAGTSPARGVCWLVGRAGAVWVTSDGVHWRRAARPVDADLVAIEARDARTADVTARDGQRFATSDAGATWQVR